MYVYNYVYINTCIHAYLFKVMRIIVVTIIEILLVIIAYKHVKLGEVAYIWHLNMHLHNTANILTRAYLELKQTYTRHSLSNKSGLQDCPQDVRFESRLTLRARVSSVYTTLHQ